MSNTKKAYVHHHCRICVMGLRGVGKTSFVRSAVNGSNDPKVSLFLIRTPRERKKNAKRRTQGAKDDSLEDSYILEYGSNSSSVVGEILDTRGDLHTLMKQHFFKHLSHSDGFVLVFSIDNDDSFEYLKEVCIDIHSHAYGNVPILIVCNKCDLEHDRKVSVKAMDHFMSNVKCKLLNTSVSFYLVCSFIFIKIKKKLTQKTDTV